jgi:hypothetical protein
VEQRTRRVRTRKENVSKRWTCLGTRICAAKVRPGTPNHIRRVRFGAMTTPSTATSLLDESAVIEELAVRWQHARRAALLKCLPASVVEQAAAMTELQLLRGALAGGDTPAVLRAVFDNSLALGRSFRQHKRTVLSIDALPVLLPQLRSVCAHGVFQRSERGDGFLLVRPPCAEHRADPSECDVWREAIDGLVLGLTRTVLCSRHSSRAVGDEPCVDAFHVEGSALRYGAITDAVRAEVERAMRLVRAFDAAAEITLLGMLDGLLHYRVAARLDNQLNVQRSFERAVNKRLPQLGLREVSPRPVFAGES